MKTNRMEIFAREPRYRIWTRLVRWVRRSVRRRPHTRIEFCFQFQRFFQGFECTINPQNLIKFFEAIFEKIEILIFFFCKLPLILRVGWKQKIRPRDISKRTLDIKFERDWWVGLGPALVVVKMFKISSIFRDFSGKSQ